MSDIKKKYVNRCIMVRPTKVEQTRKTKKKYSGLWYIIKEKPINIYKDLGIRIIR